MSRRSLLFVLTIISVFLSGTLLSQDRSAMWNAAKRVKFGLDPVSPSQPIRTDITATPNPDSPPNGAEVQVFNPSNFWQSENSIGVNFSNSNQLMVSTNGQIPGSNPVVQQTWAFSTNGGVSWPASLQSENIPPGILDCFGDPVAFFDRSGRAYFSTLGSPGGVYFVSTTDFGATWSARSNADNLSSGNDDKQHAAADYSGLFPNNVYTAWTDFGVTGTPIQFARSTNQGASWLPRVALPIGANRGQGAHIMIGPNGEVYVIWGHYTTGTAEVGVGMAKSTDGGATFNTPTVAFPINGSRISNGGVAQLNGTRTSSFPYGDVDRSNGPYRGRVYVVASELDVANTGQADINIHRSSDGGTTWDSPIKVNGPDVVAGRWQWMPTIAVDPTTGGITVSYYSFDSTGSTTLANRYAAYSADGGTTWDNWVISDVRATWAPQGTPNTNTVYNGDYYETAAMDGKAWPCWTDRRLGASGTFNRAYVERIIYSENFGFVRGTVTALGTATPVSGAAIDFVESILQQGATTDPTGFYFAGAKVDTPGTTANVTLRGRKFGYIDTTVSVTLTRGDTLNRNFQMRVAPGGTLDVYSHTPTANLRSYVEVKFGGLTVISDSTNGTTGHLSAPLPTGTYSVRVDAPSPYVTKTFPSVVITAGATTNVNALTDAVLTFNPTAVRDTLPVGGSRVKNLAITNNTADTVSYRITDDNALRIAKMRVIVPEPAIQTPAVERPKGSPDIEHGDRPDGHGGPDAFGYSWVDSDEPGGPPVQFVDISSVGTQITTLTSGTLDDGYATVTLPTSLNLYGLNYTSINIGTNGFVNFGTGSTSLSNGAIPSVAAPNNAIYAFWDDLDFRTRGRLLYYNDVANGQFIVQYDHVPRYNSGGATGELDTLNFQIVVKATGEIFMNYGQMYTALAADMQSSTIGVENAAGTVALQVVNSAAYMHSNLTVRVYLPDASWLSENPTIGRINPGANQNIQVTFDATGLTPGTQYNASLFVEPTHPDFVGRFTVPAGLKVQAADSAIMSLRKNSVTFPATQINTTKRDTNWARNVGLLPLNISSITSNNPKYVVTPASGTVTSGDSLRIVVTYTPTTVGTDTGRVILLSNSQGTPRKDVTLSGSGIGAPGISVSVTTIADTLQVGQSHNKTFQMTNTTAPPTAPLYVAITDSGAWLNVTPASDTLAGSQTKNYTTAFNSTGLTPGTYNTNIRITSNDPANPLKIVAATLRVVGGPVISTRPDSTSKSLALGASGVDSFYIKNTGVSALNWQLSEAPGSAPDMSRMQLKYHVAQGPLPKGMDYPVTDEPDTSGGPDAFGYRFIDSDSPGGPAFSWVDISSSGTQLDSLSAWVPTGTFAGYDEGYYPVRMPFSFSYYGVSKDSIFIGSNGNVMFQRPTANIFTNAIFPTAGGSIDEHIGVWWDDLQVSGGGCRVYYGTSGGNFVVQYQNISLYSGTVPNYTFEVILSPNGTIKTQYLAMGISGGTLVSSSIGMENAGGTIGLNVDFNAAYVHNNLAILFSRGLSWLDESPTSGSINPGDSAKVRLDFNTTGLLAGLQRGVVSIASNDFAHNPFNYVVRLTVTGGPPTLTVTSPNGGEQWDIGSSHNITWNQNGVDSVTIAYSTTGRTGTYTNIASVPAKPSPLIHPKELVRPGISGNLDSPLGTFSWTIPNAASTNCFVRIVRKSSPTPGDTSDAAFTIKTPTVTGDTSWTVQSAAVTTTFYTVKAVDANVGWAAGTAGVVVRTTNGGTTWTSVGGGAIGTADIYTMDAIDANTAFVSTSPSATFIYKTSNGGTTWTQVYTLAGGFIDGIQMTSPTVGYAMGDPVPNPGGNWELLKTTDGGTTWTPMTPVLPQVGSEAGWNNSFQVTGNNMWFGTNASKVYHSTDLGATWTSAVTTAVNSYGVRFNNASTGATGFDTGINNVSSNGGTAWVAGTPAGTGQNTGVAGVAGNEFWMSSSTSGVYYTSNLGTSWSNAAKNGYSTATAMWAINMVSPSAGTTYGWAVGATSTIVRYRRIPTGVATTSDELPTVYALNQNYPNPFNPTTKIKYDLPEQSTVTLKIYNVLGQEVATLAFGEQGAGRYEAVWDGKNSFGSAISSGVYFYRFEATGSSGQTFNSLKKMMFLK